MADATYRLKGNPKYVVGDVKVTFSDNLSTSGEITLVGFDGQKKWTVRSELPDAKTEQAQQGELSAEGQKVR